MHHIKTLLLAGILAAFAASASADEVNLLFVTRQPEGIPLNTKFLHPWAEAINKDGQGIVHIDIRDGFALADVNNVYSRLLDDVFQIGYSLHNYIGGKFPRSAVAGLPGVTSDPAVASAAFWRLYETGMLDDEYDEIVPLVMVSLTQSGLQLVDPLPSLDNLDDRKVAVTSKIQADVISALGGVPQSFPVADLYGALQRRTIEGMAIGWPAFPSFNFQDVTHYHVNARLGTSTAMLFMSKKKWDSLPQAVRDVFAKHMGEQASREFGEFWAWSDKFGRSLVEGKPGHEIVDLTPEQEAAWNAKIDPIVANWASSTPDGGPVLAKYKQLLADVAAGK